MFVNTRERAAKTPEKYILALLVSIIIFRNSKGGSVGHEGYDHFLDSGQPHGSMEVLSGLCK
jgi:hypothetical protein